MYFLLNKKKKYYCYIYERKNIESKCMSNIINMVDGELMLPALHPFADGDSLPYGQNIDQLKSQLGDGSMYLSSSSSDFQNLLLFLRIYKFESSSRKTSKLFINLSTL